MKSKIGWVRRGQRAIRMVSELHRMGYQRLRIMPFEHPNAWRLAVGPCDLFSERNGAFIPDGTWGDIPIYSSAGDGSRYFDWEDAKTDDARALAEKFVSRFPDIAKRGFGKDWAYAGWLAELIGFLEGGDWLPVTYWEYMKGEPEQLKFLPIWDATRKNIGWEGLETIPGPDVRKFPLPPSGREEKSAFVRKEENPCGDITLLSLAGEGGGLDLVLRMTGSGIYSYRLISNSSEAEMFEDEDFSNVGIPHKGDYMETPLVIDWQGALKLLDDRGWPWPLLTPLYVHASISRYLIHALKDRYARFPETDFNKWDRFF